MEDVETLIATTCERMGVTRLDARRFWSKVEFTDDCWPWTGWLHAKGYGLWKMRLPGVPGHQRVRCHRFAYESLVGPIPKGLVIDHLCRVRHCVRPSHMEPVTIAENSRRGDSRFNLPHPRPQRAAS